MTQASGGKSMNLLCHRSTGADLGYFIGGYCINEMTRKVKGRAKIAQREDRAIEAINFLASPFRGMSILWLTDNRANRLFLLEALNDQWGPFTNSWYDSAVTRTHNLPFWWRALYTITLPVD